MIAEWEWCSKHDGYHLQLGEDGTHVFSPTLDDAAVQVVNALNGFARALEEDRNLLANCKSPSPSVERGAQEVV